MKCLMCRRWPNEVKRVEFILSLAFPTLIVVDMVLFKIYAPIQEVTYVVLGMIDIF